MHRLLLAATVAMLLTGAAADGSAPEPGPQRAPRQFQDPSETIDRGNRGTLDEETETGRREGSVEDASRLRILPRDCELELALAASPEHLRDGAGTWALTERGYRRVRQSKNGFDCIVNRDHPRVLKPTCFDAEGAASIVPKIVRMGDWLVEGATPEELRQKEEYGFVNGDFERPSRAGVAYMLSNYNRPWFPQSETLGWFPPHIMFYAPDLTNDDIGFDPQAFSADKRLPFVAYQGPHGFIIMVTGENRPRTKDELRDCPSWVWQ